MNQQYYMAQAIYKSIVVSLYRVHSDYNIILAHQEQTRFLALSRNHDLKIPIDAIVYAFSNGAMDVFLSPGKR